MTDHYPVAWQEGMTKGEALAAEIRLQIVKGTIQTDTLLTENQVAKQYNVSRSPVRDAFKLLQTDQLIQLERMGAKVLAFGELEKRKCMTCGLCLNHLLLPKLKIKTFKVLRKICANILK